MDSDFGEERRALDALPDSKAMANHHSSYNCIFNTIDTIIGEESYYAQQCAGEFPEMSSRNAFGGGPASIMSNVDGSFYADPPFAVKFLQKPNFSALMAAEASDADALLDCSRDSGDGVGIEGRSVSILTTYVNVNAGGVENGVNSTGWGPLDAAKLGADVSKFGIGNVPTSTWTNFPSDPAFVERAVKFSSFGNAECIPPENVASGVSNLRAVAERGGPENANASAEPAKSAEDGLGKKKRTKSSSSGQNNAKEPEENKAKRCRVGENSESDDNTYNEDTSDSTPKKGKDKNAKSVQKEDNYIHVRARRGQATDSHSLAERVRREKINERMKFLQDLVPTCNKVTGKAVMLDEIINYVQSLQHQVEFLSMKLATVNPKLDFNIDSFLAKEMCGNFPSKGVASPYFHIDQFKQASLQPGPSPGSDILSAISSADSAEMFDGANFQRQSPSGANSELQNMYNTGIGMGLLQGRLQQQRPL